MPVRHVVSQPWNGAEKANQFLALVCAKDESANMVGDDEESDRHQVGVGPPKTLALERHALFEFRDRRQGTNIHRESVSFLAIFQRSSISAKGVSSIFRPVLVSSDSMC